MSAQPSHVTTLETIEHLDVEHELPCEHSWHASEPAHPADLLIRSTCGVCNGPVFILGICFEVWGSRFDLIECGCGHRAEKGYFWKILEVLS